MLSIWWTPDALSYNKNDSKTTLYICYIVRIYDIIIYNIYNMNFLFIPPVIYNGEESDFHWCRVLVRGIHPENKRDHIMPLLDIVPNNCEGSHFTTQE